MSDSHSIPIGRSARSLPEQVAEQILESIMAGRLTAGTHLKELALAQEHAVSRATIREALIALEKRRFVERIPRYGARVTELGSEDVWELFEVRGVLLGLAAARCADSGSDALPAALEARVQEMWLLVPEGDPHRFAQLSVEAQHLLLAESGNRYLIPLYEQLASLSTWRLVRNRALSFVQIERRQQSAEDWTLVKRAIVDHNAVEAEQAARRLLQHSASGVRAQLAAAGTVG